MNQASRQRHPDIAKSLVTLISKPHHLDHDMSGEEPRDFTFIFTGSVSLLFLFSSTLLLLLTFRIDGIWIWILLLSIKTKEYDRGRGRGMRCRVSSFAVQAVGWVKDSRTQSMI